MCSQKLKIFGLAISCFALGTIVQIFVPDIFIVMFFAAVLLIIGIFFLKS